MVRLHMVNDKVIRSTAGESLLEVGFPLITLAGIGGIHNGNLIIQDKV